MNPKYKNVFFSPNLGAGFDTPDVEPIEDEEQDSPASEESVTRVKPKTRLENLLAKIAGNKEAKAIKPKNKGEALLNEIADNQGEGGGGSGGGSGGSGGALIATVTQTYDEYYNRWAYIWNGDKTFGEIYDAMSEGKTVYIKIVGEPPRIGGSIKYAGNAIYTVVGAQMTADEERGGIVTDPEYAGIQLTVMSSSYNNQTDQISMLYLYGNRQDYIGWNYDD